MATELKEIALQPMFCRIYFCNKQTVSCCHIVAGNGKYRCLLTVENMMLAERKKFVLDSDIEYINKIQNI